MSADGSFEQKEVTPVDAAPEQDDEAAGKREA
jgi:hypothetical protein